jgi:alkylation response protein AidB-like acyl-CoA dehydrogenase
MYKQIRTSFWKPEVDPDFVQSLRNFTKAHVDPIAADIDAKDYYPREALTRFAQEGFIKGFLPKEYGGHGDFRKTTALFEELGYSSGAFAVSVISLFQAHSMMARFASKELNDQFMPRFAAGMPASYSLTESNQGNDIRALETTAEKQGDEWVINGEKVFITSGEGAEFCVMLAKTQVGVSAFAVPYGLPGCEKYIGEHSKSFGLRNGAHVNMKYSNVRIPAANLIGTEGKGVSQALATMARSRTLTAAICTGIARAAFDGSLDRAKNRKAADKTVLDFQGIQWYFSEMFTEIEMARMLTYRAADAVTNSDELERHTTLAKYVACRAATSVSMSAMQICGGYGASENTPFSRYVRDAKTYELGAGSSEIMKNTIAKYIVKNYEQVA